MNLILQLVDYVLHLEKYLPILIQNFGLWTYLILLFIIFMETGFVVTPFLPGDSLIFAAAATAALAGSTLHVGWLFVVFCAAAILGIRPIIGSGIKSAHALSVGTCVS